MKLLPVAVVAALVAGLGGYSLTRDGAAPAAAAGLVPYDSCGQLLAHHREVLRAQAAAIGSGFAVGEGTVSLDAGVASGGTSSGAAATGGSVSAAAPQAARAAADTAAVGRGGTGTNLQEQDVDEPDRAKLRDGKLVVLAKQRLTVFQTTSATPTVLSSFPLDPDEQASELLLVGDRAVVVAQSGGGYYGGPAVDVGPGISLPAQQGKPRTTLLLLDLSDPREPELLEEARYDGSYLSARLVDGTVRLVTASTPQAPIAYPQRPGRAAADAAVAANEKAAAALPLDDVLPQVERRTGTGRLVEQGPAVACDEVTHALDGQGSSTLVVTTLRPQDGLEATDSTAVTAHGDLVYASSDRLYVGTSRWGTTQPLPVSDLPGARVAAPDQQVTTELHAFDTTSPTTTRYVGTGSVDGYVMGRWALSEHEGALRVATTMQPPWESREKTSSSVAVLRERDGALVEVGRVDGLGKDERIQAVRYFGDLAAVVTFRQTDPLYLVDLADETKPAVLGELKVPGFSTYLHPLGDGLLLGLGNEATDTGQVTGMQVSVFDVRDLSSPKQVDRLQLGAAYSSALEDSRAFGYDPSTRLATLPLQAWSGRETSAVGVEVREDGTLREVGRMQVHTSTPPDRVLSDGERVYAVNRNGVAVGDARTMERVGAADVPSS